MSMSLPPDFDAFKEGYRFLTRRPLAILGLAAAGAALGALPPLLQIRSGLPDTDIVRLALLFAGLFPLDMYLVPRFLAEADASRGDRPENPAAAWAELFDGRWMRAMGCRLLLYCALGFGFMALVVPGLVILFAFGWAPTRVLLRGESLADAARGSFRIMVRAWRRVLSVFFVLVAVNLVGLMILSSLLLPLGENPTPWARLTHPLIWLANFLSIFMNLWTSTTLLALFRRVEAAPESGAGMDSSIH
jgi:hypothetical protein